MKTIVPALCALLLALACAGPQTTNDVAETADARPEVRYYVIADT